MSADYWIIVAAKRKDENVWHNIDPYVRAKGGSGCFERSHTYWNGSRSYFSNAWDKLRDIAIRCDIEAKDFEEGFFDGFGDIEDGYMTSLVKLSDFNAICPKDNQFSKVGFVLKSDLANEDELEFMEFIDAKEHHKLSTDEQKCYQFFEGDDEYSWQSAFKDIGHAVSQTILLNQYPSPSYALYGGYDLEYALVCIMNW